MVSVPLLWVVPTLWLHFSFPTCVFCCSLYNEVFYNLHQRAPCWRVVLYSYQLLWWHSSGGKSRDASNNLQVNSRPCSAHLWQFNGNNGGVFTDGGSYLWIYSLVLSLSEHFIPFEAVNTLENKWSVRTKQNNTVTFSVFTGILVSSNNAVDEKLLQETWAVSH